MAIAKGTKRVAENRKARHEYFIEDTYECGIALVGTEVKSIRAGKVNLRERASTSSNSLGLYPKDTEAILLGFNGNWAHVIVDGKIGFMLTTYLK